MQICLPERFTQHKPFEKCTLLLQSPRGNAKVFKGKTNHMRFYSLLYGARQVRGLLPDYSNIPTVLTLILNALHSSQTIRTRFLSSDKTSPAGIGREQQPIA